MRICAFIREGSRSQEGRWAERRWGENLGAPGVQLTLTVHRAGFEPFRGHSFAH
jgi:hypothetical protein